MTKKLEVFDPGCTTDELVALGKAASGVNFPKCSFQWLYDSGGSAKWEEPTLSSLLRGGGIFELFSDWAVLSTDYRYRACWRNGMPVDHLLSAREARAQLAAVESVLTDIELVQAALRGNNGGAGWGFMGSTAKLFLKVLAGDGTEVTLLTKPRMQVPVFRLWQRALVRSMGNEWVQAARQALERGIEEYEEVLDREYDLEKRLCQVNDDRLQSLLSRRRVR
jgi:hypothetical protein